jgi:predicted HTH domain antitoxin
MIDDGGETMIQLTIDMPEGALAAVHHDPQEFARALRLAAAVKWYEMRRISQGRAAEIAGLSRSEFLTALGLFGVSPFQEAAAEILEAATLA